MWLEGPTVAAEAILRALVVAVEGNIDGLGPFHLKGGDEKDEENENCSLLHHHHLSSSFVVVVSKAISLSWFSYNMQINHIPLFCWLKYRKCHWLKDELGGCALFQETKQNTYG